MASVKKLKIAYQKNSDTTIYATWSWTHKHTKEYSVEWQYTTGNGVWFTGTTGTETRKMSTYSFPSNALKARIKVKPISTTYKKKVTTKTKTGKKSTKSVETHYWKADKKTSKSFNVSKYKFPAQPSAPTVKLDTFASLTMEVEVSDDNTKKIEFDIWQFDATTIKMDGDTETISFKPYGAYKKQYVTVGSKKICNTNVIIKTGASYRVRCRGINSNGLDGDWSNWSELIEAPPEQVTNVKCEANSTDSVKLSWSPAPNGSTYYVEYTSQKDYFRSTPDQVSSKDNIDDIYTYINGLDRSKRWYFRVKAVNKSGIKSELWSSIVSTVIGTKPNSPSTWSSALKVMTGEEVILYWIHNTEDGSSQTYAEIEIQNGEDTKTITVKNDRSDDDKDKTSSYKLDTSEYPTGAELTWRVRTRGVTDEYGEWSIQRTIHIYSQPSMTLSVTIPNSDDITELSSLPFYILCQNQSAGQKPIGYYITISPLSSYVTLANTGEEKIVNVGEIIYSKYVDDLQDIENPDDYRLLISAGDIALEDDVTYKITANMSLDSGLQHSESIEIPVSIEDSGLIVDAEISIDTDAMAAFITPYCLVATDEEAQEVEQEDDGDEPEAPSESDLETDVLLAVYRREFDGTFKMISSGISNQLSMTVTDPHPSLDYARYRIVATKVNTGRVSYYDVPGVPVGSTSIFIQWDEKWTSFNRNDGDGTDEPVVSGSIIELPYNVDVSESYDQDVALVEYIGRRSPVSYYGTQISEGGSWTVDIPKEDKDTIYALRRLGTYQGDVYVREPSGLGYWAQVTVSFSQKHKEVSIPVTLNVTRVEGDEA